MKKKLLIVLLAIFLLFGCSMSNTPTSKVDELLMKYQKLDNDIKTGINDVINSENFTEDHAARYRELLNKQYKNLTYEVKNEIIDGDNSTVTVQIEVVDYKNANRNK